MSTWIMENNISTSRKTDDGTSGKKLEKGTLLVMVISLNAVRGLQWSQHVVQAYCGFMSDNFFQKREKNASQWFDFTKEGCLFKHGFTSFKLIWEEWVEDLQPQIQVVN